MLRFNFNSLLSECDNVAVPEKASVYFSLPVCEYPRLRRPLRELLYRHEREPDLGEDVAQHGAFVLGGHGQGLAHALGLRPSRRLRHCWKVQEQRCLWFFLAYPSSRKAEAEKGYFHILSTHSHNFQSKTVDCTKISNNIKR